MTGRLGDDRHPPRGRARCPARRSPSAARRARRRRARARRAGRPAPRARWHGTMNYAGFTRPVWTWLRGETPARRSRERRSSGSRSACRGFPASRSSARCARSGRASRGRPSLHSWAILDSHDTARFRVDRGLSRAPARRRRAADDDARRADGLRRRRDRARGRLGRGRAPDDAVGRARRRGTRSCSTATGGSIALRRGSRGARARRHPLRARLRRRDRVPARGAGRDGALPRHARRARAGRGCRSRRSAAAELETLVRRGRGRSTASDVVLPAGGPAFHAWRVA